MKIGPKLKKSYQCLTLKLPITSIVVWVLIVCLYAKIGLKSLQEYSARGHKQTTFSDAVFLGVLRVEGQFYEYSIFELYIVEWGSIL